MPSTFTLPTPEAGKELTIIDFATSQAQIQAAIRALQDASPNSGSVTSVAEVDSDTNADFLNVNITNPTTAPVITFTKVATAANLIYASAVSVGSAKPTMRAMVAADLPTVPYTKGGNGLTTLGTAYQMLRANSAATANEWFTMVAGSNKVTLVPSSGLLTIDIVPANIEVNALAATAPLGIAKGGTGAATAQAAINALANVSVADSGKALIVNGSGNLVPTTFDAGVSSVNGLTGVVSLTTASIPESGSLYLTDVNLNANTEYIATKAAVALNTAKVTNATHTGDVTGATALTIAAGVVTYAKMQAISATKRLLGRISGGAGSAEEIAISGNLAMSATDLIVRTSKIKSISANYSIPITEGTILANGSSLTITLPDTSTVANGDEFIIKNIAGATNNSLVVFNAGIEEIDGSATYSGLNLAYNCVTVKYGGSNRWYIINKITTG
jgi:hypothetical protein